MRNYYIIILYMATPGSGVHGLRVQGSGSGCSDHVGLGCGKMKRKTQAYSIFIHACMESEKVSPLLLYD